MSAIFKALLENVWIRTVLGFILAVGGYWVSLNVHPKFLDQYKASGIEIDLGKTLATVGVLLILFPLIKLFFLDPLTAAIDERNSNLERTFATADNLNIQMKEMRADYERRLQQTEAEAREQIQAQIREAQQLRQTLMAEAAEKADALVAEAQVRIGRERNQIINDIRLEIVDLSLAAAEKVIGENMDSDKNRRIVAEFIDKVEVAR